MRRLVSVLLLVSCAAAAAGALAATSSGSATTRLVSGILLDGDGYQLSADAAGAATVMWTQQQSINGIAGTGDIRVRQQNPDGDWGATVQIGGVTQVNSAALVEAPSGAAVVAWTYVQRQRSVISAVTRATAAGAWSAPRTVAAGPIDAADFTGLTAAIDAAGVATVAWSTGTGADPALSAASVDAATGTVGPVVRVAASGSGAQSPSLAVNAAGVAVLSWLTQLTPTPTAPSTTLVRYGEMAAYRPAAGSWGAPARLGTYREPSEPVGSEFWLPASPTDVVTANGTAAVGWRQSGPTFGSSLVVNARSPTSGSWSPAHRLSLDAGGFGLVAGPHGSLVAVWSANTSRGYDEPLVSAVSRDGTSWSTPAPFARLHDGTFGPYMTADSGGAIALTPLTGNGSAVESTVRSSAGRWSALARAGSGDDSEIAFGPHGSLTLVWETLSQTGDSVHDALQARSVG